MSGQTTARSTSWLRVIVTAVAIAVLLYLVYSLWAHELIVNWMTQAPVLPFFVAMALLPAVGIPITPFFLLAGATFGGRIGIVGSLIALAANLTICYLIATSRLSRPLKALLKRLDIELPNFQEGEGSSLRFVLIVKATPAIPGFVKCYALGLTGVPFALYFATSMAITGVYGIALITLGQSLFVHDIERSTIAVAVVVIAAVGFLVYRKRNAGRLAHAS